MYLLNESGDACNPKKLRKRTRSSHTKIYWVIFSKHYQLIVKISWVKWLYENWQNSLLFLCGHSPYKTLRVKVATSLSCFQCSIKVSESFPSFNKRSNQVRLQPPQSKTKILSTGVNNRQQDNNEWSITQQQEPANNGSVDCVLRR